MISGESIIVAEHLTDFCELLMRSAAVDLTYAPPESALIIFEGCFCESSEVSALSDEQLDNNSRKPVKNIAFFI
jgi:hypothetical protein